MTQSSNLGKVPGDEGGPAGGVLASGLQAPGAPGSSGPSSGARLHDRLPRCKPTSGGGVMTFVGATVCLMGTFILVIGMGWLAPEKANVPLWVLQIMGASILALGLGAVAGGLAIGRNKARREQARREHPSEPWLWDYTGKQRESAASGVHDALLTIAKLSAVILFLAPFHWIGIYKAWPFLIFCGLFDLILLCCLGAQVYRLLQGLKFGRAKLMLGRFPFFLGEELQANFQTTRGGGSTRNIEATLTLRCIEETRLQTGSGKNAHIEHVFIELYAQQQVAQVQDRRQGWNVPVFFAIPSNLPPTDLSGNPAIYWEVEIQAALPGVDLCEKLLVPVYKKG